MIFLLLSTFDFTRDIFTINNGEEVHPQFNRSRNDTLCWYTKHIQNKQLKGIIQVLICLPYAPKPTGRGEQHDFKAGTIRYHWWIG